MKDSGPGMSKEELARATDRFDSGSKARSRLKGSAGLGLSIASELMNALGGKLELESELGLGTTARLRLPLTPQPESVLPRASLRRNAL